MNLKLLLLNAGIVSLFIQCGREAEELQFQTKAYEHFTFYTQGLDQSEVYLINLKLEEHYDRILQDHGLEQLQKINFHVFNNINELREAVKRKFPEVFVPDFARGLTPSATEVYLVNSLPVRYTMFIHEFSHCVTQHLNATIPNNPRWLWESVALFEAGELVHPKEINILASGNLPTLNQLSNYDNSTIYQVGYLIGEFVFQSYGKEKYIELIRNNGNVEKVLGMSEETFMNEWYQHVKQHYNFLKY